MQGYWTSWLRLPDPSLKEMSTKPRVKIAGREPVMIPVLINFEWMGGMCHVVEKFTQEVLLILARMLINLK